MATTEAPAQQNRTNSIPLRDLESGNGNVNNNAGPVNGENERPPSPPPEYKEEDMEEPLPPYMARVRMVMRREQPIAYAMPEKRTGICLFASFFVIVAIVIGVSVGFSVRNNNNDDNN